MPSRRLHTALPCIALGMAVVLAGCAKGHAPAGQPAPKAAQVVAVPGTSRVQIQLTAQAVRRLGLQTAPVTNTVVPVRPGTAAPAPARPGAPVPPNVRSVLPYSAVLYAASGDAFTYMGVGPDRYERSTIKAAYVVGDLAVLDAGPPAGTPVVTVGGPELLGVESGTGG